MSQLQIVTRAFKIFVVLALILFVAFAVQGSMYFLSEGGGSYEGEPININIPPGTSLTRIATILEEEGIVKHALLFRFYARYKDLGQNLQAGDYELFANMHPADILEKLQEGRVYREQIRFTIAEGLMTEQIARSLSNAGLGEEETFLSLMSSPDMFDYDFLQEVPEGLKYPLEGYLFPDTYFVHTGVDEKEVLEIMLKSFDAFYSESVRENLIELDLSLHELVTLASIVEREALVDDEKEIIAGVFHNRLARNWLLQADPTVQYARGDISPVIYQSDLERDSPYNTYLYQGLPPGPIGSPGKVALKSTLYPQEVQYMFFVSRFDGTGRHFFSVTLAEHNANVRKSRQNRNSGNN